MDPPISPPRNQLPTRETSEHTPTQPERPTPRDMSPPGAPVRISYRQRMYTTSYLDDEPPPNPVPVRRGRRENRSPDDARLEPDVLRRNQRGIGLHPSAYLVDGVIRFEDLHLDNSDVRANQLESANVVDPAQDRGPQRDVDPPRVYTDVGAPVVARLAAAEFAPGMEAAVQAAMRGIFHVEAEPSNPQILGRALRRQDSSDPIPDEVRNGAVEHFLRRAHEPPIPQPEPGKCSELHKWVCDFIDARDDDTHTEATMTEKATEIAAVATVAAAGQQADATVEMEEAPAAQESLAKPPKCFFCPISHQALRDPVTASDGYTYERNFLSIQFSRNIYKSPMTRESLQPMFFPNRAIVEAMHDWVMAQNPPQAIE